MNQIIKTSLGMFFLVLLTALSVTYIRLQLDVAKAQNFADGVLEELENSHMNKRVETACKEQAEEYGYELTITYYDAEEELAEVLLRYPFEIPVFHVSQMREIKGYTN